MSRPKVKCYDLRSTRALRVEGDFEAATGEWREREEFDTLAAAKTWCDSKLAKAAG